MEIIIITSSRNGTASYCLPFIAKDTSHKIAMVVFNSQTVKKNTAFYKRKVKKILKIGFLGTLNGIRMRKWFTDDVGKLCQTGDIEIVCKNLAIPFYVVDGINNSSTEALLQSVHPDLGLSLGNSYIGKKIFSIPKFGMINIHGELLPQFKNAQSVIWQIYEGNSHTGYTIHEINSKIDDGAILKKEELPVIFMKTLAETVSYSCAEILKKASEGLVDVLNNYTAYSEKKIAQNGGNSYTTPNYRQFLRINSNFKKLKKAFSSQKA